MNLTHFAYNEWPVGVSGAEDSGLVPGSTHGILGLVEHALAHQEEASLTGPIAVHCRSVITRHYQVITSLTCTLTLRKTCKMSVISIKHH